MVDLMDLLRDVLVCSLQVWMLNDFGKNMFPYRVGSLWKRIGVYFAAALCIFIANHMGTTLFNITIIPVSYTIAAIIIFQGENLPMIHSTIRTGMERIRNPITMTATSKKRIIIVPLSYTAAHIMCGCLNSNIIQIK